VLGETATGDAKELLDIVGDVTTFVGDVALLLVSLQIASRLLGQHGSVDC
jgi:hypothetical protein